jgi:hypothetical protein
MLEVPKLLEVHSIWQQLVLFARRQREFAMLYVLDVRSRVEVKVNRHSSVAGPRTFGAVGLCFRIETVAAAYVQRQLITRRISPDSVESVVG